MNYFIDNNLPPSFAKALDAFCEKDKAQVVHLRDKFKMNTSDLEWITTLSKEKSWVIITQDNFLKNPHEKEALRQSGLVTFVLKSGWSNYSYWDKAYNLVRWWPRIMEQADGVKGGAVFTVPFKFSGKGKFEQPKL